MNEAGDIPLSDIDVFQKISTKAENDKYNKIRENIIQKIINDEIPKHYYNDPRWEHLKNQIYKSIKEECRERDIELSSMKCKIKAGRKFNYDLLVNINDGACDLPIEFKFNAKSVSNTPQFVSPTNPSKFFDSDQTFEENFYDNCLPKIASKGQLPIPDKQEYLNSIHSNNVPCMSPYKIKYNNDKEFNRFCKNESATGIKDYIETATLNTNTLTEYLIKTQKGKIYWLFDPDSQTIKPEKLNETIYEVTNIVNYTKNTVICQTKSGMKISVLLRFKNGNGIQFPALQISRKIPIVKELQKLCIENDIIPPRLKADICKILDDHHIIY